jgi:hypothetical protein
LGINQNHLLNYAVPIAGIMLMPKVNIRHGIELYSNILNTIKNTTTKIK